MRTIVIPARLASTRLPNKLLLPLGDRPLIVRTWEAATRAKSAERVLVATDSPEIAESVRIHGGEAVLTPDHFTNGTERIAWVAQELGLDHIVNLQGDEPRADPGLIDRLFELLEQHPNAIGTGIFPAPDWARVEDPSAVKVVRGEGERVLYFSRAVVPFPRDAAAPRDPSQWWIHIGIYAYSGATLQRITAYPPAWAERTEQLEQLRWLAHGETIHALEWPRWEGGVDTLEDYERVEIKFQMMNDE